MPVCRTCRYPQLAMIKVAASAVRTVHWTTVTSCIRERGHTTSAPGKGCLHSTVRSAVGGFREYRDSERERPANIQRTSGLIWAGYEVPERRRQSWRCVDTGGAAGPRRRIMLIPAFSAPCGKFSPSLSGGRQVKFEHTSARPRQRRPRRMPGSKSTDTCSVRIGYVVRALATTACHADNARHSCCATAKNVHRCTAAGP